MSGNNHIPKAGHTVAVTQNNELYAWGDNFHGQLGEPLLGYLTTCPQTRAGVKQVYYNASTSTYQNNTLMFTPNKVRDAISRHDLN